MSIAPMNFSKASRPCCFERVVSHRDRAGIDGRVAQGQAAERRIVREHHVQSAVQGAAELSRGRQDVGVEPRGLGMRVGRIDGRQHHRPPVNPRILEQQYRQGAGAQQLPVGHLDQPARRAQAPMAFGHDEIGADLLRAPHDGFVRWIVPAHRIRQVDLVLARRHDESVETLARLIHGLDAQRVDGLPRQGFQRREYRRRQRMEQLERRAEGLRDADGLQMPGWRAASGSRTANSMRRMGGMGFSCGHLPRYGRTRHGAIRGGA